MTSRLFTRFLAGIAAACFVLGSPAEAQLNSYVQAIRPFSAVEGEPLVVSAALNNASSITRVVLFYRQLGVSDFHSLEMELSRDSATVTIPANEVAPPFVELYVSAETQSGARETYPVSQPQSTPARISILPRSQKDAEILLLNPDANEAVSPADLYISVSFVYAGEAVDRRRTKLFLNGVDLSSRALATGDLLILSSEMIPEELKQGACSLAVRVYDTTGAPYHTVTRTFMISRGREIGDEPIPFLFSGSAQAESRSESIKDVSKVYNRFDVRANSTYGILRTTANLQLTSEEKPENQPQNRYYLGLDARYVKLGLGDVYPQLPSSIMDGRRVRGASLTAGYGVVQIAASSGEIVRGVDIDGETQTHRRTLTAIRPSFGKGETFQWGFTYLHSKDEWAAGTTLKPRENVVAGTDLYAAVDDRRIEWTSQASVSISNMDISSPEFTADSIDVAVARGSISAGDGDNLKRLLPIASKLITFNENISPLNPSGLSSLSCETALSFNYFNNYIKGTYTFHGNEYASFGTTSFRNDIQGYNITDRLRLFHNVLFVTGSLERLSNNVSSYQPVTTTWTNMTASVSYFGASAVPDITVGVAVNDIANDALTLDATGTTYPAIDYATDRFFIQSSYMFRWIGQHNTFMSLDYTKADDRTTADQDLTAFNGLLLVTTVHSQSLESTLGVSTSITSLPVVRYTVQSGTDITDVQSSSSMAYTTITLGLGYKFFQERMKAAATASPTFGDVRRTQLEGRLQFALFPRHIITAQYRYIVNSSIEPTVLMPHVNDSAFTIAYRMDL